MVVLPLVLLVGAMVWYDATSVTIKGVVVRKQETVKLFTTTPMVDEPFTERKLLLHVTYTPPDSPMITWGVKTPADRYDRTHVGDEVSLRYLKAWPRISIGLADRTAVDRLRDARAAFDDRTGTWYLWEIAGFVILLLCATIGGWLMLIVTCGYLACAIPLFFADRGPLPMPAVVATAVLGETTRVDKTPKWGTRSSVLDARDLTQPYESVELTYIPGPGRDSVRAVDAIDAGSGGALVTGAPIAIHYDPARPRSAQLAHGTRTFRSRNRFDLWPELVAPGVFSILGLLVSRKRRRRATSSAGPVN
ncbi:MAG: hypothetical protein ABIT38_23185 [Gemmatimonadaceae bacterium]